MCNVYGKVNTWLHAKLALLRQSVAENWKYPTTSNENFSHVQLNYLQNGSWSTWRSQMDLRKPRCLMEKNIPLL
jgi:hypothetical protein